MCCRAPTTSEPTKRSCCEGSAGLGVGNFTSQGFRLSVQFLRGFVVSTHLRNIPQYVLVSLPGKTAVSANLRKAFAKSCADKCKTPGSRNSPSWCPDVLLRTKSQTCWFVFVSHTPSQATTTNSSSLSGGRVSTVDDTVASNCSTGNRFV